MAKVNEIPITFYISPFPNDGDQTTINTWLTNVGGFCNGTQVTKTLNNINSIRIGNLVHVEGSFTKNSDSISNVLELPVPPKDNGFILTFNSSGETKGIIYTGGQKSVDISNLVDGTYFITSSYLTLQKESN